MEKTCGSQDLRNHSSLCYILLLFLILLPFGTWFGCFFWRQLNALPQEAAVSQMTRSALKVYIAATTCSLWLTAVIHLFFPILDALDWHRLVLCALVTCASNLSVVVAYVSFQRVLLERLKVTFTNTTHAIGPTVAKLFDALQLCLPLCVVLITYAMTRPCFVASHIYEVPGKWHIFCRSQNRSIPVFAIVVFALAIIGGNVCIVVMYVWRMKAVFLDANLTVVDALDSSSKDDSRMGIQASTNMVLAMDLMRKSTVIAIWSVGSSLLVLGTWAIPFQTLAFLIDLVLNEVLVYCLFPVGDDLYDTLLGFCHFTVDCYLPKRTLDIEMDFMNRGTFNKLPQPRAIMG